MNIFHISECPIQSAQWQHDRHVVKMILESSQMLSTACYHEPFAAVYESCTLPNKPPLYKVNHLNHPSTQWVREHPANFVWLTIHLHSLLTEYGKRFPGRTHKCHQMFYMFAELCARLVQLPNSREWKQHRHAGFMMKDEVNPQFYEYAFTNHTPFAVCMPDGYRKQVAVDSYRAYYLATKVQGNRWTQHPTLALPEWLEPVATIHQRPVKFHRRESKPRQPRQAPPGRYFKILNPNAVVRTGFPIFNKGV